MTTEAVKKLVPAFWEHLAPSISPWSMEVYKTQLPIFLRFLKQHGVTDITTFTITQWIGDMVKRDLSSRTIRQYRRLVQRFFDFAVAMGHAEHNPVMLERLPKLRPIPKTERHTFAIEDYRRLLADIRHHGENDWYDYVTVGFHTGLRLGDAASLLWVNVDWENECLKLTPSKTQRFGKTVQIPMAPELFEVLSNRRDNPDDRLSDGHIYIFPLFALLYRDKKHTNMVRYFNYRCTRAGVPVVGFHAMRHTFVSRVANAGVNYHVIGSMTGQTAEQIAEYHHVTLDAQRAAIAKANVL